MTTVLYRETQPGTAIVICAAIALAIEAAVTFSHRGSPVPQFAVAMLSTAVAVVFSSMTISISETDVTWWLAFGSFRRSVLITDIAVAATRRVTLSNGLGIRTNGRDWLWIVNGSNAVTLEMRDGRAISLGSGDADRVASLIDDLIARRR